MEIKEFDTEFQKLCTTMVEAAFRYVGNNREEVDTIYLYASCENRNPFFNVFFRINGTLVHIHKVNTVCKKLCEVSDDTAFGLLDEGVECLDEMIRLFQQDNREVPTLMKMTYSPKTGAFNNDILYDPQYSSHPDRSNVNGFEEWFEEMKQNG